MKKSKISLILLLILIVTACSLFFVACNKNNDEAHGKNVVVIVCGDISGFKSEVALKDLKAHDFKYEKDGEQLSANGYRLSDVLSGVDTLAEGVDSNNVLITSKEGAGTAALIKMSSADKCYVVYEDGESIELNIIAPDMPRVVNIKGVWDICVIAVNKDEVADGLKLVVPSEKGQIVVPYGSFRLDNFYRQDGAENELNGNTAKKFVFKNSDRPLVASELTLEDDNIIYFDDLDVVKDSFADGKFIWEEGRLCYFGETKIAPVFGIVGGTDSLITDAFDEMLSALRADKKVLYILPDGFSWEQYQTFYADLDPEVFGAQAKIAASMNPAISPVGLAAISTGASPYVNGQMVRSPAPQLNVPDIFVKATELGKQFAYIEGDGTLINSSIMPTLSERVGGYSDRSIKDNALAAIAANADLDLLFVHFHGIDDANHEYGALSTGTFEAEYIVNWVEGFIKEIMTAFDADIVIIVPDHGHISYEDENGKTKGKHGFFTGSDMFVPFYVLNKENLG